MALTAIESKSFLGRFSFTEVGANFDDANPELLLRSQRRFFKFLSPEQQKLFLAEMNAAS